MMLEACYSHHPNSLEILRMEEFLHMGLELRVNHLQMVKDFATIHCRKPSHHLECTTENSVQRS